MGKSNPPCPYCKGLKVIKHGASASGNQRFRCRECGKTWVLEKLDDKRPDIADLTIEYLNGRSFRDLVSMYYSSPLRINKKIREFLSGCPKWEEYVDISVKNHDSKVIYLIGKKFASSNPDSKDNTMYLALAVDALSTVILGHEIGRTDSVNIWTRLISRLKERDINAYQFVTNGKIHIENVIENVFPRASVKIFYEKAYRDKELNCCLTRVQMNNKLLNDALKIFVGINNKSLNDYMHLKNGKVLRQMIMKSQEEFILRLKDRLDHRNITRTEGLTGAFKTRFEKFHMLKENPEPIINGWIAKQMLEPLEMGFSRLSLYMQLPAKTGFKDFSCGNTPEIIPLPNDSAELKNFIIEIATRGLQLPIMHHKCEMKIDKCSLF